MPDPQPEICPFLASINDPDSVYNYPSGENRCGKSGGQIPVASDYQLAYCLRARHWFCPVFTGAVKNPPVPIRFEGTLGDAAKTTVPVTLPSVPRLDRLAPVNLDEKGNEPKSGSSLRGLAALFLVCVLGIGIGGVLLLNGRLNETVNTPLSIVAATTASSTPEPTATASLTFTVAATETATVTLTVTATNTLTPTIQASSTNIATPTLTATALSITLKACTPPTDWQAYTVAVGETYYKIAVKFNTTVDALQRVNCLSNPGKLLAGQTIYVPPLPATP